MLTHTYLHMRCMSRMHIHCTHTHTHTQRAHTHTCFHHTHTHTHTHTLTRLLTHAQVISKGPVVSQQILSAAGRYPPLLRRLVSMMEQQPELYRVRVICNVCVIVCVC